MLATERRKGSRRPCNGDGPSHIEIEHPFGSVKKSVLEIYECDEYGASVLVPHSSGYFMVGTPLRFSLIENSRARTDQIGVVRYYHPVYGQDGEKYYRIGIEKNPDLRDAAGGALRLRPPRVSLNGNGKQAIVFELEGKGYRCDLIDISKYSAAFVCDESELIAFRASAVLSRVRIFSGQKTLFDGEAIITRVYQDAQGKNRVVIEPRKKIIDIDLMTRHEAFSALKDSTRSLVAKHDCRKGLDSKFKAAVADLRLFLEDFKNHTEKQAVAAALEEHQELLAELYRDFCGPMDSGITTIDGIVNDLHLDQDRLPLYKDYYQKNLLQLLITSPYNKRVYTKPAGYPGDYEMIRMICENRFEGATTFGRLMNKYATSIPIAETVRKRTRYFTEKITGEAAKKDQLHVLSIASGPALEFDLLLKSCSPGTNNITITLLDQDIEALRFSQEKLYEDRIKAQSSVKINFIHQKLGTYIKHLARRKISQRYDMVYASGLFDYFDTKTSAFVIKQLLAQTGPGGKLIIANLSLDGHNHRTVMEFGLEWYLIYRTREDLAQLAECAPRGTTVRFEEIANGICKFIELQH